MTKTSAALIAMGLIAAGCGTERRVADVGTPDGSTTSDSAADSSTVEPIEPPSTGHLGTDALLRRVNYLASDELAGRDEGTAGGALAREYIIEELEACGVEGAGETDFLQPITTGEGFNILGRVQGTDSARAERTIVLSAHYDHITCTGICNGADDNAAGVALTLGLACKIAENPLPRSVLFAFWDAEEPPTFLSAAMGSDFFVAYPTVPREQIDVAIVLDLVGGDLWDGYESHFLAGAEYSPEVGAAVDAATVPGGLLAYRLGLHMVEDTPLGHQPWSDYHAFREAGVPVLFLSNGQNKRYHQPDDEVAYLNIPKMGREALLLDEIISNLGNATTDPTFDRRRRSYETDARSLISVLDAALAPGGIVDSLGLTAQSASALERDRNVTTLILERLEAGEEPSERDLSGLRAGAQRLMCLAGSTYPENTCGLL